MFSSLLKKLRNDPLFFLRKDKRVGSVQEKRRYDLPLNKSVGTGFLILLVALMSFLGVLAMSASYGLSTMTRHWSEGLENKATIEIPAERSSGGIRSGQEVEELQNKISAILDKNALIEEHTIMSEKDIRDLISPWLGQEMGLGEIPLPGLISVELEKGLKPTDISKLADDLKVINKDIVLDTHESWLGDLLKLTGALKFSAGFIALIIGLTTVTAIAGAIRSRMAIHSDDVQLLHLMGASDFYISRQFQRHALIITLQGSALGVLAGLMIMGVIALLSGDTGAALLPEFTFTLWHFLGIMLLPLAACVIAALTARFTVLRVLTMMP